MARIARIAVGTAVGGLLAGFFGAAVGVSTDNVTAAVVLRGGLTLIIVLVICRAVSGGARRSGNPLTPKVFWIGALLGFLLNPMTWAARTALTQLATDPGPATLIGDLLLWALAAGLGRYWAEAKVNGPAPIATPYG